ncbi:MAG TPA: ABC transporter ATP-binding protein [Acidimicrobiales bacterium]|nr:ABC transporter ATP-binding protein [Acidimicrobiales bacterium]
MSTEFAVEAQSLVKTYPGGVEAVRGISFDVRRGESFGLLGPNGAGKTTTIGMLTTAVTPTSGRAVLAGRDVARDPVGSRAISSVVFQDAVVDAPLTGRQNLELHLRLWGVARSEGRRRLEELGTAVGLTDILDRAVATYSGGERRRLEIIRALLSAPQVLFLDEPTVGLDTRVRHDLFDVVTTLRERTGVTVILTTHYLDEAERLCDRLAVIDNGALVACDTPAALLASMGPEVLELRVDRADLPTRLLEEAGVPHRHTSVVGSTVVVSLASITAEEVTQALERVGVLVMSATRRRPTLDDVYLRLTGAQLRASDN